MAKARVLKEYCKGCQLCVEFCHKNVLKLSDKLDDRGIRVAMLADADSCSGCGNCALMCPDAAIEITEDALAEEA